MTAFIRSGDPFVWLAGSALVLCLLMIAGLVGVVLYNGLGFFWARDLVRVELNGGERAMGELINRQLIAEGEDDYRVQLKVGNRDVYGLDFRWIPESQITARSYPADAVTIERAEWGNLYGTVTGIYGDGEACCPRVDGSYAECCDNVMRVAAEWRKRFSDQGSIPARRRGRWLWRHRNAPCERISSGSG